MENEFELGAYLKSYRQQRHISLRAASPDAASTLSRFENGKTRISGDRLRAVMQREGVRYWDLQQHSSEFLSPFKQLIDRLYVARFETTSLIAKEAVHLYEERIAGASGELVDVINAVLAAYKSKAASQNHVRLAPADQQRVQDLLFRARDWIICDYGLVWLAAPYLDSSVLKRVFRRAVIQNDAALPAYGDYFARVLQRVSLLLLCRHDSEAVLLCAPLLNASAMNVFDGEDALTIQFLQIMTLQVTDEVKLAKLASFQSKVQLLELKDMHHYFASLATLIMDDTGEARSNDSTVLG
ncbi:MAG: helix-turn-helix domain-containing protein [Lacticaseibacillus songhuajiangensis]|jgi:transcriptional regulator with XRE-family HTH domain|nr:helix-turn-helix domain-containing protein [Lacticaseibacillus songhuajiangensis]